MTDFLGARFVAPYHIARERPTKFTQTVGGRYSQVRAATQRFVFFVSVEGSARARNNRFPGLFAAHKAAHGLVRAFEIPAVQLHQTRALAGVAVRSDTRAGATSLVVTGAVEAAAHLGRIVRVGAKLYSVDVVAGQRLTIDPALVADADAGDAVEDPATVSVTHTPANLAVDPRLGYQDETGPLQLQFREHLA